MSYNGTITVAVTLSHVTLSVLMREADSLGCSVEELIRQAIDRQHPEGSVAAVAAMPAVASVDDAGQDGQAESSADAYVAPVLATEAEFLDGEWPE